MEMLQQTLRHAVEHIPYYRSSISQSDLCLAAFPIIDSEFISENFHALYNLDSVPDFILTSGGSMSPQTKLIILNQNELDLGFRRRLRADQAISANFRLNPDEFPGIAVVLTDNQHGVFYPPGHGQPVIALPLEVGRHLKLIERFLKEGINVRGRQLPVIQLMASATKLRCLTSYLMHSGYSGGDFDVKLLTSMGFFLSNMTNKMLAEFWECQITDAYGLTEFLGSSAIRCPSCNGFHLPDTIYAEFLDPFTQEEVSTGVAELVLTSLVPYRTAMPLIRYATGDIVELNETCERDPLPSFTLHGRRGLVQFTGDQPRKIQLTALDLINAIEFSSAEHGDILVYDDQVASVMSWGSGVDKLVFERSGYPRISIDMTCNSSSSVVVEVTETNSTGTAFKDCVLDYLSETSPSATVGVKISRPGGITNSGMQMSLV